jgi:hypothetical protein
MGALFGLTSLNRETRTEVDVVVLMEEGAEGEVSGIAEVVVDGVGAEALVTGVVEVVAVLVIEDVVVVVVSAAAGEEVLVPGV